MTQELSLLVWSVALTIGQMVASSVGANQQVAVTTLVGNRADMPALAGWAGRARRAHLNMLENLPLFAALVLAAQLANRLDGTTALGAQMFFWARLLYAIVYIVGIPWLRTIIWAVAFAGLLLIFSQLV